ncbi:MAG TPA: GyrI-like domain-containing protein [Chitinophagaceae bacterium]|nr:GyrI-like domain-containing protein [Chitinophagaceae bacterium]
MKKWLIIIVCFLMVALAFTYLFIPTIVSFSYSISLRANPQGLYRSLLDEKSWHLWWPENSNDSNNDTLPNQFFYNGYKYTIDAKKTSSIFISITGKTIKAKTILNLFPISNDSVQLVWEGKMPTSYNLIKRMEVYFKSKQLKHDISLTMGKIDSFFSKTGNIYGSDIQQIPVLDSILVSTHATSKDYPTIAFIYDLIDQLKEYIRGQSAKETGFPMLNITTTDSSNYLTRVAIPVNKRLKPSGKISYRWMMGGGKILVSEVRGGPASIDRAFQQIENYIHDYHRTTPAIPFLSLVTDRRKEPDTAKWITKIYYPVM